MLYYKCIYVTFSFYIVSSLSLRKSVCSSMNEKLISNYHTQNIVIICVRESYLEMEYEEDKLCK